MKNKAELIQEILGDFYDRAYYSEIVDEFINQFGIEAYQIENLQDDVQGYQQSLEAQVSKYLDKTCSEEELAQMVQDETSDLYSKMLSEEYKKIISNETKIFYEKLKAHLIQQGLLRNKSPWERIKDFFNLV